MSVFKDENEVYTYIGKVFEMAVTDPVFVEATKDSGLVVKLTQTDPAATILIDFPGQKVSCGEAAQSGDSTVDLRMTSDDSHKFWLGKLNSFGPRVTLFGRGRALHRGAPFWMRYSFDAVRTIKLDR